MTIVGLGNPGEQYSNTKHNAGYWVLDKLANELNLNFKLGKGEYVHSKNANVRLVKPLGFMNNSGVGLKSYMDYFNIDKFSFNDVWDNQIKRKKLHGALLQSNWYHVGDIQGLKKAISSSS